MKIPVLTYHAMNVGGNAYADNDHVAFAADLRHLTARGLRVAPLPRLVREWLSGSLRDARDVVALTCDDGADFDFRDLDHPAHGPQRSMLNILRDFREASPAAQPGLHLTSFVIVSPEARRQLDRTCMVGRGWWNDDWWAEAAATGLMAIGNHSWDHNHDALERQPFPLVRAGTFESIEERALADHEIRQAGEYLRHKAPNEGAALFAYPYGETNDFLAEDYLPGLAGGGEPIVAAFTTDPDYWTPGSDRWRLPRFVCGRDWRSPGELDRILEGARA
ncbi:MAG TPA: polysaccharide deacetylase family protein [Usitatibacter sp.]|nr:polysaccharide deacetylase family protein [Usitatibacter sp.]